MWKPPSVQPLGTVRLGTDTSVFRCVLLTSTLLSSAEELKKLSVLPARQESALTECWSLEGAVHIYNNINSTASFDSQLHTCMLAAMSGCNSIVADAGK